MINLFLETKENIIYFPILIIFIGIAFYKFNKSLKIKSVLNTKNLLNFSETKIALKVVLLSMAAIFLFFCLLSPAFDEKSENIKQEGRDIFIALDISRSMLAKDLSPSRLESAKQKIKNFLNLIDSDRIGLILFSGNAFVQCPLTRDLSSFYLLLDQVDTEVISTGTTSIEKAIKLAIEKFDNQERKNKLLIIFTDGEDFSSNLSEIKQEAIKKNLSIFTIGCATAQGSSIPIYDEHGFEIDKQKDDNNQIVISKLNEGILRALSQNCSGQYLNISKNDDDMNKLVELIKKFEKEKIEDKKLSYRQQQYPWFLAISFICLLIDWLL